MVSKKLDKAMIIQVYNTAFTSVRGNLERIKNFVLDFKTWVLF